jgi:biopolymer transport protein ExbB
MLGRKSPFPQWIVPAAVVAVLVPILLTRNQSFGAPNPAATAPSSVTQAEPAGPPPAPEVTVWEMFRLAGFFMYPLALASVLCVALVIERFVALRQRNVDPPNFLPGLKAVYKDPIEDREAALAYCRDHPSAVARMIAAGVKRVTRGQRAVEKAIEDAGANEALKLRKNLRFLYAVGSVATLLGLIGTISGMIKAFQVASAGGMGQAERLSKGIYEAMVNTFAGLAVAIVATFFYYFFIGRVERLIGDLNDTLGAFAEQYTEALPQEESGQWSVAGGRSRSEAAAV